MATVKKLIETWRLAKVIFGDENRDVVALRATIDKKLARNKARRDRHAAMTDLGLMRVKGNLGGTYYE